VWWDNIHSEFEMNTRRSFFKQLALGVAAVSSAHILLPKAADAFKWKQPQGKLMYVVNPEYVDAPYEVAIIPNRFWYGEWSGKFPENAGDVKNDIQVYSRAMGPVKDMVYHPYPPRLKTPTGPYVQPFIQVRGNPKDYFSL
jgi:hypothetical protein